MRILRCMTVSVLIISLFITGGCGKAEKKKDDVVKKLARREVYEIGTVVLSNQNGEKIEMNSLLGKPLIMTFLYTRCPSPTMCPLIMRRVVRVQQELADYKSDINFAVVTVDPEYDTPRVLKEYGEVSNVDFSNFVFLTGEGVYKVIEHFGVNVREEEPGMFAHSMDTFLIDSKSAIRKVFPGSFWDIEWAADEAVKLLKEEAREEESEEDDLPDARLTMIGG